MEIWETRVICRSSLLAVAGLFPPVVDTVTTVADPGGFGGPPEAAEALTTLAGTSDEEEPPVNKCDYKNEITRRET